MGDSSPSLTGCSQSRIVHGRLQGEHTLSGTLNSRSLNGSFQGQSALRGTLQRGPTGVPTINGIPIVGDISLPLLGLRGIYYDKTENWNLQSDFMAQEGAIYIYSDYHVMMDDNDNEVRIPDIKIGDGTTPLIDLPFVACTTAQLIVETILSTFEPRIVSQAADTVIQRLTSEQKLVTEEDRYNWNHKVTSTIDPDNPGNLVLSF